MCKLFRIFVQIYKMHRLILGLLPLFFISISCKKQVPEGILSQQDMVELMSEVHILDGYIANIPVDSAKKVIDPLYEELFTKFGIDSSSFNKNINYYYGNPGLTVKVYDEVVKNLEKKERNFYSQDSLKNIITQDSINRVVRLQRNLEVMNNRIINAAADSSELTIAERTRRLYEPVGLMRFWEKNLLQKPENKAVAPPVVPNIPTVPATETPVQEMPVEMQLQEKIDTSIFQRRDENLKPVRKPRVRPMKVQ